MKSKIRPCFPVVFIIAQAIAGCSAQEPDGPPSLRLGRDECAECGMLINDFRCSTGSFVDRDGQRTPLVFDDIGCMLDYEEAGTTAGPVLARFLHDHSSKIWMRAEDAVFVAADPDTLRTPMGSGIVAFRNRADAEVARTQHAGRILNLAELLAERKAALVDARENR